MTSSEIPRTAWKSTSSALRNASTKRISFPAIRSSFSFGMTMIVSTRLRSSFVPPSACRFRVSPSKENGRVTIATVSAPTSFATSATTGPARSPCRRPGPP